jgi:uncharacterized protein (DUF924 family)
MPAAIDWSDVYDFWFPPEAGLQTAEGHRGMLDWWFAGGSNEAMRRHAPILEAAAAGQLDHWRDAPLTRLCLILVLDQFPRGLFPGQAQAYAYDGRALGLAEEGLANGHFDALAKPWEKTFFAMPLCHAEGAGHLNRLDRLWHLTLRIAQEAPAELQFFYQHSIRQVESYRDVIARFGHFPHRNPILGRDSTPEEAAYIAEGSFVHKRRPAETASAEPA